MATNDMARLMAIKNALQGTTSTQGWLYIKQIAENLVSNAVSEALEEEDRDRGESKRLKAAALKKGFNDLWNAIENAKQINPQTDFGTGFEEQESEDARTN